MSSLSLLPVVDHDGDPALKFWAVHLTGRARSAADSLPEAVRHLSAEQRLAAIFLTGWVFGFPTFRTGASSIVSMSDLSAAELRSAFSQGLNGQGRCDPWALILRRDRLWEMGARPVLYVDEDRASCYAEAAVQDRGSGWDALVQPTRITWTRETGKRDWLNEREWRFCWPAGPVARLDISSAIVGVVVGRPHWDPTAVIGLTGKPGETVPARRESVDSAFRWVWDEAAGVLRDDGRVKTLLAT